MWYRPGLAEFLQLLQVQVSGCREWVGVGQALSEDLAELPAGMLAETQLPAALLGRLRVGAGEWTRLDWLTPSRFGWRLPGA
tara:strand:+ start:1396 stop:1641 length:246 start_codon:yes stop_codon:yes gene_type:complete